MDALCSNESAVTKLPRQDKRSIVQGVLDHADRGCCRKCWWSRGGHRSPSQWVHICIIGRRIALRHRKLTVSHCAHCPKHGPYLVSALGCLSKRSWLGKDAG